MKPDLLATSNNEPGKINISPSNYQSKNSEPSNEYAQALAKTSTIDFELSEKLQPKTKHFVSKKILVSIVVSLVLSLLMMVASKLFIKNPAPNQDKQTINELLQTTKDLQELETQ